jgi:hypothetical protein
MPAINNFAFKAGDDKLLAFVVDPSDVADLTGCTIRWWAARSATAAALIKKDNIISGGLGGVVITDGPGRTFTVELTRDDTLALSGELYHEAAVVDTSGYWATVGVGMIKLDSTLVREDP